MSFEKPKTEPGVKKEKLDEIKLSDYSNLEKGLSEWLEIKEDLPSEFWKKIKNANEEKNLK
jgi:hypothetical protein